ncbi:hypothetical protein O6H91_02G110400 [Diphasiastrum complanatum]|uniref:Uncharacterized protein n=1 Tax=Diphasiastrum complanatum TaxID=34168 RepID=A0ACC2EJ04_DIPCM|nr:hypothetical protein O6H91_02G110400 [Diphasiastrum complanatum]
MRSSSTKSFVNQNVRFIPVSLLAVCWNGIYTSPIPFVPIWGSGSCLYSTNRVTRLRSPKFYVLCSCRPVSLFKVLRSLQIRRAIGREAERLVYSRPVVILDLIWNLAFVVVTVVVLILSRQERPSTP